MNFANFRATRFTHQVEIVNSVSHRKTYHVCRIIYSHESGDEYFVSFLFASYDTEGVEIKSHKIRQGFERVAIKIDARRI